MEGFAPFCLVCCFVAIQLYHKFERTSSVFYPSFSCLVAFSPVDNLGTKIYRNSSNGVLISVRFCFILLVGVWQDFGLVFRES